MTDFITVLTSTYPQDLYIIKGRLESEGIYCFLKDELTVQSNNFYSNAVGGVKLQVLEEDVERARAILIELGYIKEEPAKIDLLSKIDTKTSSIPFFKKIGVGYGIILIVLAVVILVTVPLYFILKPATSELVTRNSWCVDRIDYKNKRIGPLTTETATNQIKIVMTDVNGNQDCHEKMIFDKNHAITLPGINSGTVLGHWEEGDDDRVIITTRELEKIFSGAYTVDISNNGITIKSATTTIYAHRDNFLL
jgi:Putative prokaryotic signal transducing protein